MSKWDSEKENLRKAIEEDKISYEELGRRYGCTGANIKKVAKKLGIILEQRRIISDTEHFNKNTGKKHLCLNCGKELDSNRKFCNSDCRKQYETNNYLERWKQGLENGLRGSYQISKYIERYLFDKYNCSCQECGWNIVNKYTNKVPLQIHHIDGDCTNNKEENLQLLCPNCHSLTENYGSRNKNATRIDNRQRY